jgi:hypothetical protein
MSKLKSSSRSYAVAAIFAAFVSLPLMSIAEAQQTGEGPAIEKHTQQQKFRGDFDGLYGSARKFIQPATDSRPPWPVMYCPGYDGDPSNCPGYYGNNGG